MTKEKSKFQLNKGGDHNFDISKGGKRKFDLTKDYDEPVVASVSKTTSNAAQNLTEEASVPILEEAKRSKKWIWIILAIIIIALLAWWLIPGSDNTTDVTPAETEKITSSSTNEDVSNNEDVENSKPIDVVETPVAPQETVRPEVQTIPESGTQSSATSGSTPVSTSKTISDDLEHEALKVIRGDYGVGQERKNKLGSNYQPIQNRVNELKREGVF